MTIADHMTVLMGQGASERSYAALLDEGLPIQVDDPILLGCDFRRERIPQSLELELDLDHVSVDESLDQLRLTDLGDPLDVVLLFTNQLPPIERCGDHGLLIKRKPIQQIDRDHFFALFLARRSMILFT